MSGISAGDWRLPPLGERNSKGGWRERARESEREEERERERERKRTNGEMLTE